MAPSTKAAGSVTDGNDENSCVTCDFCHLPPNLYDGLGDLFGPYYASTSELIQQSNELEENHDFYTDEIVKSMSESKSEEIRVDVDKNICYVKTPRKTTSELKNTGISDSNSVKEVNAIIEYASPQLQFVQTIDYLLPDQKRTNASQKTMPRVPGFNGKIVIYSSDDYEESNGVCLEVTSEQLNLALIETESFVFVKTASTSTRMMNKALWIHG